MSWAFLTSAKQGAYAFVAVSVGMVGLIADHLGLVPDR